MGENRIQYLNVFERFLPEKTARYCFDLWDQYGFEFKITKSRKSKLGDFRFDHRTKRSTITVNHNLNRYSFLVTYLHEVAHYMTFKAYGNSVQPHGAEWKANFKKVSQPILQSNILPEDVLAALSSYLKNPKATSCTDPQLVRALNQYDGNALKPLLFDLPIGSNFQFNSKTYKSLEKKRTRIVCLELKSGRKYLINGMAQVEQL